ncbi:hypothetical protein [Streptomyces sp. NPDC060027]|uniref:hypothetical protein n=1 Tax=Streptomyces sp. NPDC060027 TaxID=3347040 RepID=UPI00369838B4
MSAGSTLRSYNPHEATVAVWCRGLFGLTGKGVKEIPIETNVFTITMTLRWTSDGWRQADSDQVEGPDPEAAAGKYGQAPQL